MYENLIPILSCPTCGGGLSYDGITRDDRLFSGRLQCNDCSHLYPVEDEIPILIDPAKSSFDWEWEVDIEAGETFDAFDHAYYGSLPPDAREARAYLINRIVHMCNQSPGPILDVATGRGVLLRDLALLLVTDQPLLGMDIDQKVLRGTQGFLRRRGLYDPVSLAVMDAKRLALRGETIGLVTTWFGFNNMPEAAAALQEAFRVLMPGGKLIAATLDVRRASTTYKVANEAGFADFLTDEHIDYHLQAAGLTLERVETFATGIWPGNPYDAIPLRGDWFAHRLVLASRS